MNRKLRQLTIGVASAAMVASMGITPSQAADDPTLTFAARTGRLAVLNLNPGPIAVTASVPGKVAFFAKPKAASAATVIKGCEAKDTTTTSPFTATCNWEPGVDGEHTLTAELTPTDAALAKAQAKAITVWVGTPINQGEGYTPVSVYVDTVTGTPVAGQASSLAPYVNNGSCVMVSQFVRGMTIVFRVYANDHTRGGIPLTQNDAKVEIVVAGLATPIALSYANHSGDTGPIATAFWAGSMATGEPGSGRFSTLGTISYQVRVTLIEVPEVTRQVKAIKYVKVKKNGKFVKVNGKFIFAPVTYTKTEVVTPAVQGKTYVYDPGRWPTSSLLTLNAVPKS